MTLEQWGEWGRNLSRARTSLDWKAIDWILHAEAVWGETYHQIADMTGFSADYLRRLAWIGTALENARKTSVEWATVIEATPLSVCAEVAPVVFTDRQRVELLADFHRQKPARDKWRSYVKEYRKLKGIKDEAQPQLPEGFGKNDEPMEQEHQSGDGAGVQAAGQVSDDAQPRGQEGGSGGVAGLATASTKAEEPAAAAELDLSIDWSVQLINLRLSRTAYNEFCLVAEDMGRDDASDAMMELCRLYREKLAETSPLAEDEEDEEGEEDDYAKEPARMAQGDDVDPWGGWHQLDFVTEPVDLEPGMRLRLEDDPKEPKGWHEIVDINSRDADNLVYGLKAPFSSSVFTCEAGRLLDHLNDGRWSVWTHRIHVPEAEVEDMFGAEY